MFSTLYLASMYRGFRVQEIDTCTEHWRVHPLVKIKKSGLFRRWRRRAAEHHQPVSKEHDGGGDHRRHRLDTSRTSREIRQRASLALRLRAEYRCSLVLYACKRGIHGPGNLSGHVVDHAGTAAVLWRASRSSRRSWFLISVREHHARYFPIDSSAQHCYLTKVPAPL